MTKTEFASFQKNITDGNRGFNLTVEAIPYHSDRDRETGPWQVSCTAWTATPDGEDRIFHDGHCRNCYTEEEVARVQQIYLSIGRSLGFTL